MKKDTMAKRNQQPVRKTKAKKIRRKEGGKTGG